MDNIEIFNEVDEEISELEQLPGLIKYLLDYEKLENVIFSIIIVNDNYIQEINKNYRNQDKPTDTISFALEDHDDIVYNDFRLLGDVYISIDTARRQAIEYEHSLLRELSFLTVHGILHLLGYDHMEESDEKIMIKKQELILDGYGIKR